MKCVVCKQEIAADQISVETEKGLVHEGACRDMISEMATLSESDSQEALNEIQFLA